jgi:hypothetical protein
LDLCRPSLDIEFYKKIELGAAHPFNPSGLVFDDGIQVLGPGKEMSPHATGAYLFPESVTPPRPEFIPAEFINSSRNIP